MVEDAVAIKALCDTCQETPKKKDDYVTDPNIACGGNRTWMFPDYS